MDYEKKYKEALKVIESLYNVVRYKSSSDALLTCQTIEKAFPELFESEDEKIRKELLDAFKESEDSIYLTLTPHKRERYIAWLEKQGEQKPTDEVKPKFKIGDWVVQDNIGVFKIIEICKSWYEVIDIEDNHYSISFDNEHMCHLWTIQDAKDGDVLIDRCDDYKNPLIFILKKFETVDFGLAQKSDYSSYCFLTADDRQIFKEGTYHHKHNIKPATKEQRNLLFSKMKEAGYEWDAENKELKKIEQKPVVESMEHRRIITNSEFFQWIYERLKYVYHENPNVDYMLSLKERIEDMQKSDEWSEKDERIHTHTIKVFYPSINIGIEEAIEKCIAYSKKREEEILISINGIFLLVTQLSTVEKVMEEYNKCVGNSNDIKEKVNPLVQWTADDESYLKGIICDIEGEVLCANCSRNIADMKINWLKSLKHRVFFIEIP